MKMYCPISLCTIVYKTIYKIVANILQVLMLNLIGSQQTSFVPGQHIIDNIVIAQEVIHSMRKKAGKKCFMAIKIDLKKAYDRLNWEFIHEALQETGLPRDMIHIIMECITSATIKVLWNGEVVIEFVPSRGIRQGDLLSLYIFVLCIERLSHGINNVVATRDWQPIRLTRRGTPLTYFLLMIFYYWLKQISIKLKLSIWFWILFCQSS